MSQHSGGDTSDSRETEFTDEACPKHNVNDNAEGKKYRGIQFRQTHRVAENIAHDAECTGEQQRQKNRHETDRHEVFFPSEKGTGSFYASGS